jgi:L-ascorbate metabolism protein UlaG (beta-lactamase superfamily)
VSFPKSDHFDGTRFFNPGAEQAHGGIDVLRWMLSRKPEKWRAWTENEPQPAPPERVGAGELRVTFVGHATVLIQFHGVNLVTDPVWSLRASPVQFAGPKRRRPAGVALETLPKIDVVLLSHNHYDHCDVHTLQRLAKRDQPTIAVPLGLKPLVASCGYSTIHELDWWESVEVAGLRLRSLPEQHFAARTPFDRNRTLWCGWEIASASAGTVQYHGDTAFGKHFDSIAERCVPPRLALLPIGAYQPEWFMGPVHMTPENAVKAHYILGAPQSMAIHFGTFPLADDGEFDPPRRLARELEKRNDGTRFWWLQPGEARSIE